MLLKKRFYLNTQQSPTYFNINKHLNKKIWRKTKYKWFTHLHEDHFAFHKTAAETLEFKHLFANLANKYCPAVIPETHYINDFNWHMLLTQLKTHDNFNPYILKPSLLNNGQHIKIFQTINDIHVHYLNSNRIGGDHILQRYV